jgi:hypothetical protein
MLLFDEFIETFIYKHTEDRLNYKTEVKSFRGLTTSGQSTAAVTEISTK